MDNKPMYSWRWHARLLFGLVALIVISVSPYSKALAEGKHHRVVIHVTENDPKKMNMVLNITQAVTKDFKARGDTVEIEIVANGPGLDMLRADKSPVKKRIGLLHMEQGNLRFSACGNTMKRVAKKEGKPVELIPEAKVVAGGVFRIMQLQSDGWMYVRP